MVNDSEAAAVREIFAVYLEPRALLEAARELSRRSISATLSLSLCRTALVAHGTAAAPDVRQVAA